MPQPTREVAIDIVQTERNYQDVKYPDSVSLGEYIDLIEKYAGRARAKIDGELSRAQQAADPMEDMRKLTALGLRTIETWGAPYRAVTGFVGRPPEADAS